MKRPMVLVGVLAFLACFVMAAEPGPILGAPAPSTEDWPEFSFDSQSRLIGEIEQTLLDDLKREHQAESGSGLFSDETEEPREAPIDPEIILQYYSLISDVAASHWAAPETALPADLTCTVEIPVEADGRATGVKIRKSSGNPDFDRSILSAIEKSSPFPPLPPDFKGRTAQVWIKFYSGVLLRLEQERKEGRPEGSATE